MPGVGVPEDHVGRSKPFVHCNAHWDGETVMLARVCDAAERGKLAGTLLECKTAMSRQWIVWCTGRTPRIREL